MGGLIREMQRKPRSSRLLGRLRTLCANIEFQQNGRYTDGSKTMPGKLSLLPVEVIPALTG